MGAPVANHQLLQRAGARGEFAVAVLALGAFTGVANGALLSPLLTPIADEFGVSESAAGQLNTLTALAAMLFTLVAAPWMNRLPRRTWLRLQIPVVAFAALAAALAPAFAWLIGARTPLLSSLTCRFPFAPGRPTIDGF
jgi:predicted MFS family arabinose efflux permease